MNYKICLAICAFSLLVGCQQQPHSVPTAASTNTTDNVTPPKYLSVDGFKNCLSTKNYGSWQGWCLPATQPTTCSATAWQQLTGLQGSDAVPKC